MNGGSGDTGCVVCSARILFLVHLQYSYFLAAAAAEWMVDVPRQ